MEALAAFIWFTGFLFGCVVLILMCIFVYMQWRILGVLANLERHMRQLVATKSEKPTEEHESTPSGDTSICHEVTNSTP